MAKKSEEVSHKKLIKQWTRHYGEQISHRIAKRKQLDGLQIKPYKSGFTPNVSFRQLRERYGQLSKTQLEQRGQETISYRIAGRAILARSFGKAGFFTLDDGSERLQLYVRKGDVESREFSEFKLAECGDILYAEGFIFKTNKGELSLHASKFHILTKAIRPLPEKFHGLTDPELRYRMRYLDMAVNPQVRETFKLRSQVIRFIREFFYQADFLEVETPMLHTVAGGAAATPFTTHHNALHLDMSLRIAPELHLKRLMVGGFNRVFELNRCFRNEGLSYKHNPEFTSIEFYWAYASYLELMEFSEKLLSSLVREVCQGEQVTYGGREISFATPFRRLTLRQAIVQHSSLSLEDLARAETMAAALGASNPALDPGQLAQWPQGKLQELCFEQFAEEHLVSPTFITEYPALISPLARSNEQDPDYVDRFELFVAGQELANAFSELNDPSEQLQRFADQAVAKAQGDHEACEVDYDYIRALEYGMPPTAGEGIGIDRLCMILTDSPSIRDVILFPQLRKEVFGSP